MYLFAESFVGKFNVLRLVIVCGSDKVCVRLQFRTCLLFLFQIQLYSFSNTALDACVLFRGSALVLDRSENFATRILFIYLYIKHFDFNCAFTEVVANETNVDPYVHVLSL